MGRILSMSWTPAIVFGRKNTDRKEGRGRDNSYHGILKSKIVGEKLWQSRFFEVASAF